MIRIASHVIGVSTVYLGAVAGVEWLAGWVAGPHAAHIACAVAAIFLFPVWLAALSLGKTP